MNNQSDKHIMVACPSCGAEAPWNASNKFRPFCSERCKLMDLGQWAAERYRVPGDRINEEPVETTAGED